MAGSFLGASTVKTSFGSATDIREGRRKGLTVLTFAALFLCRLFLEPLFASIPNYATAPALVIFATSFLTPLWDPVGRIWLL